jgi:hypothetical protein
MSSSSNSSSTAAGRVGLWLQPHRRIGSMEGFSLI